MGNFLDAPITEKNTYRATYDCGNMGCSEMQGWRKDMEDQHITKVMPSLNDHLLLAVFDGHGGKSAAIYAERHLITVIENTEEWKRYLNGERSPEVAGEALSSAFLRIDDDMRAFQRTPEAGDSSGCTAVVCMVTPMHIICANAGDSRSVLGTGGNTIPMSEDHKPTLKEEQARIVNAGGFVQMDRVDGDLAVSRAFGDFQYKQNADMGPKLQKVSACPDIKIVNRSPEDEVLVLACDGLWDVFTSEEAIDEIRELFLAGERDIGLIAEEMLDLSLIKGSRDNISAVVHQFPGAVMGSKDEPICKRRAIREKEEAEVSGSDENA